MKGILIVFLLIFSIAFPLAWAHPFTEETNPSSTKNAPVGTKEVTVFYSEPVELDYSSLKVLDSNGDQIDNKDTKYYKGDDSLIVTTPPLEEGVYTVASKTLSKIDGHLVDDAFIFGVGNVKIEPQTKQAKSIYDIVFFPEASARFPGLVGQTIVLGAVIASLLIWGTQNKKLLEKEGRKSAGLENKLKNALSDIQNLTKKPRTEIEKINSVHHSKFMKLTGIGLLVVLGSNIAMIGVQMLRLETSAFDVIQTTFGTSWLIRMIITIILLGIWFWMYKGKKMTKISYLPMLILSLGLIGTSTMIGHGSATGQPAAVVLDYVHNLVAGIWIGGIIYFAFILIPTFSKLDSQTREKMCLVMIPRFSIAFIIAVGVVIISGPTLMWFLESDVGIISESIYGKLIIAKIAIAVIMVGLGALFQYKIQRSGEKNLHTNSTSVYKQLKRTLKVDVGLGIVLLGVVALLTNGTLPSGEIQKAEAQEVLYGFKTLAFSENVRYNIEIDPFSSGQNTIGVTISDFDGKQLKDANELKVKISNPEKNIAPIEIPMTKVDQKEGMPSKFQGDLTFGFSGKWKIEIEAQRSQNANESVTMNLIVKPRLPDLQTEIVEYDFPETTKPLFPLFDGNNSIWISDPTAPRLWQFSLDAKEFKSYSFDGDVSVILTMDSQGKIWFNDPSRNQIGSFDPETKKFFTVTLPKLAPTINDNTSTFVLVDFNGNIWVPIINKDKILKYIPSSNSFEEISLPKGSLPFALAIDADGKIWFSESGPGKIGYIDPQNNEVKEISTDITLDGPEAMIFDNDGNLWIAEHTGAGIVKFNPFLETFEKIPVPDSEALPFGMAFDRYDNLWIAQHVVDNIAAYDPQNKNLIEVKVPTPTSFVQFMTSDSNDNVWFVEQQGNKLGMVKTTEVPLAPSQLQTTPKFELKYTELASPLIAGGILATSLVFVKSVKDKRRLNSLVLG